MLSKRKDSFIESYTYIAIMDAMPNYDKLYFKIGKTINFKERQRQLKTANPFIKTILLQDFDCEYFLHQKLKENKYKNEWYSIESKSIKDVGLLIKPHLIDFINETNILNERKLYVK